MKNLISVVSVIFGVSFAGLSNAATFKSRPVLQLKSESLRYLVIATSNAHETIQDELGLWAFVFKPQGFKIYPSKNQSVKSMVHQFVQHLGQGQTQQLKVSFDQSVGFEKFLAGLTPLAAGENMSKNTNFMVARLHSMVQALVKNPRFFYSEYSFNTKINIDGKVRFARGWCVFDRKTSEVAIAFVGIPKHTGLK